MEQVVQELESGDLLLEDILKKYEEGNKLVQACAAKLNEAEKRIEILMKEKNGSLSLKPFESAQDKPSEEPESTGAAGEDEEKDEKELF